MCVCYEPPLSAHGATACKVGGVMFAVLCVVSKHVNLIRS